MAKPKKSTKEVMKWKKKKWIPILAPPLFRNAVIGESFVLDSNTLIGKTIQSNLMTLTGDMKKQHTSVRFKIIDVKDGKAETEMISLKLSPATTKRSVRRRRDRIDCVFKAKTKDKKSINAKLMLVTRNNTVNSTLTTLRKKAIEVLTNHIATISFEDIMKDVLSFRVQIELKRQLKTIYPVLNCEIRFMGLENAKASD